MYVFDNGKNNILYTCSIYYLFKFYTCYYCDILLFVEVLGDCVKHETFETG